MESLVMKVESERIEVESGCTNNESSKTNVESITPSPSVLSTNRGVSLITGSVTFSNVGRRSERSSDFISPEFANEGSHRVFEFGFPLMKDVYFSDELITGKNAENWSLKYGKIEQCDILDPLYKQLSTKAISRLQKMAKGKGIFNLAVPKRLKFVGDIEDCQTRFEHGLYKLKPYYLQRFE